MTAATLRKDPDLQQTGVSATRLQQLVAVLDTMKTPLGGLKAGAGAGANYYRESGTLRARFVDHSMKSDKDYIVMSAQEVDAVTAFVRDRQAEGDRYLLRLLGSADTALENARSYVREQEQKGGPTLALRG